MTQSICPECLKYSDIGEKNRVGFPEEENIYKCTSCEEIIDIDYTRGFQSGEINLDWIQTHKDYIKEVGEDNIFNSISTEIRYKKGIGFEKINDPLINRILNSSFLDFSCLLLYGKRYKQIMKMDESWIRDREINKLLDGYGNDKNDILD